MMLTPLMNVPAVAAKGQAIIVTSTTDSGPGTLRQALLDTQSGDTITFDPAVFPPDKPATIFFKTFLKTEGHGSVLPYIKNRATLQLMPVMPE